MLKRAALVVLGILLPALLGAQTHPVIFNSAADQARRAQMRADYYANPSSPATFGGRMFKFAKEQADQCRFGTPGCDDADGATGGWCGILSQVEREAGNTSEADAYAQCAYVNSITPIFINRAENCPSGGGGIAGNFSREHMLDLVIQYDRIYPGLTSLQRTAYADKLNLQASCHSAAGGSLSLTGGPTQNFRATDTDQITGEYFGMAVWHKISSSYNATIVTIWNDASRKTGGYVATAANDATRRNAIKRYITWLGRGGHWMESWEYNLNTIGHAVRGAEVLFSIDGSNDFPEIRDVLEGETLAWKAKAALAYVSEYFKPVSCGVDDFYNWGDSQVSHDAGIRHYTLQTALILAGAMNGTTIGGQVYDWAADILDACTFNTIHPRPRPWMQFDPYQSRVDHTSMPLTQISPGVGIMIARTGWGDADKVFGMQFQPCLAVPADGCSTGNGRVDHAVDPFGEFQLWRAGEFAITHPYTYGGPSLTSRGTNGFSLGGASIYLWTPEEYYGEPVFERNDTHGFVMGASTQGGSLVSDKKYNTPATFIMEQSRTLFWLPGLDVVVSYDRGNALDPDVVGTTGYNSSLKTYLDGWNSLHDWWIHSRQEPTVTSNRVDYPLLSGDAVRVTTLLPSSATFTKENEASIWGTAYGTTSTTSERRWHVRVQPTVQAQWVPGLLVWDVHEGTPITPTLVQDTVNKVDGVQFNRGGLNRVLLFNAQQGPNLDPLRSCISASSCSTPGSIKWYPGTNDEILDGVRNRETGFEVDLTISNGNPTKITIANLDPNTNWTYSLNGGATQDMTVTAQGNGTIDTALTGSVNVVVGEIAPPPPVTVTTTSPLPDGQVGTPTATCLAATEGLPPYTWNTSAVSGSFPAGLTLGSNGCFSGTPTTDTTYTFVARVCDSQTIPVCDDSPSLQWTIDPEPPAPPQLNISATVTGTIAFVRYGHPQLDFLADCTVTLRENSTVVATRTSLFGFARRIAIFTELAPPEEPEPGSGQTSAPGRLYTVQASCEGMLDSVALEISSHQPLSGTVTARVDVRPHATLGATATHVTVQYSAEADMSPQDETSLASCASGCTVSLPGLTRGLVYHYRHVWRTSGGAQVQLGPVREIAIE